MAATAAPAQNKIDRLQFGLGYSYAPQSLRLTGQMPLFDEAGPGITPNSIGPECFEGRGVTAVKDANGPYTAEAVSAENVNNILLILASQRADAILECGAAEYAVELKIEVRDGGTWKLYNGGSDSILNQFMPIMARFRFSTTAFEVGGLDGGGVIIHQSKNNQFALAVRDGRIRAGIGPIISEDMDYMRQIIERRGHAFKVKPQDQGRSFFDVALVEVDQDRFAQQLAESFQEALGLTSAKLGMQIETLGQAVDLRKDPGWLDEVYREAFSESNGLLK